MNGAYLRQSKTPVPQQARRVRHPPKQKPSAGFRQKSVGKSPTENVVSIPGKPPLRAKVGKPPLLSISRVGVVAEPDREARPSGGAEASDPARLEDTAVVQNRIATRIGPNGWITLGNLPDDGLQQLTELERAGALTDELLKRAVIAMGNAK